MTSSLSTEMLSATVRKNLGEAVSITARRPGQVYQVAFPAYLPDGDAALLFIEPGEKTGYRVSDLGHTMMRLSYTRDDEQDTAERLAVLAKRHGFALRDGELVAPVAADELIGALLGLAQIEATAESALTPAAIKGPRPEEFRRIVIEALRREFRDYLELDVTPPGETNDDFHVDAVVHTDRPVAIAIVPNDVMAERAIGTRFRAKQLDVRHWVAIPKDIEHLARATRARLLDSFVVAGSRYQEQLVLPKLRELAA
jgi:hypothetical protein